MIVKGNYYNIQLYLGLKNKSSPQLLKTLFNDESTKLLTLPQQPNSGNLAHVSNLNHDSGVKVSFLQQLISYIDGITLEDIFADPNVGQITNNVTFEVNSFFLNLSNQKVNIEILEGINVTLYTKKQVMDQNGNMNINIYKYNPVTDGNSQTSQVNTIYYNTRYVKSIAVPAINIASSTIPNWNSLLESISYTTLANTAWTLDTAFNATNTNSFLSIVNLNAQASTITQPLLFACETNGIKKIIFVNKQPLLRIVNKIGMPILEIDANGAIKTSVISANTVILNSSSNVNINASLSNYSLYSILGNNLDNII
jgi:hypothetical protein